MESSPVDWVPPDSFDEYRLIKALGRGSMGQVWLAHDTVLDRLVAVKFIAEIPAHDAIRQRFLTEARAAARVQHPNIIAIYRVGEIGPRPYLISEYVPGDSLDQIARPVAWPRLLAIAIGLARGLAAAHRQGVLHCDLKPADAIVSESGEVKLLDFGLAKLIPHIGSHAEALPDRAVTLPGAPGDPTIAPQASRPPFVWPPDPGSRTVEEVTSAGKQTPGGSVTLPEVTPPEFPRASESRGAFSAIDPLPSVIPPGLLRGGESRGAFSAIDPLLSVTSTGEAAGARLSMSPDAWCGEPAMPRSDVYSLGALLYWLGAGAPPRGARSPGAGAAFAVDPPPLTVAAPGIDAGFAGIVDRCLRRDPSERFASGDAVLEALEALAPGDAPPARVGARPAQERLPARPRRAVLVGAALALALAWFAYAVGSRRLGAAPGPCPWGMVPVPAGTFQMGSPEGEGDTDEHPPHEVTLPPYCIDRTEVTVAAYAECAAAGGCRAAQLTTNWANFTMEQLKRGNRLCNGTDRPDHPINCVDWDQAAAYCTWKGKRLPTEAEWEYAARGNDRRLYPWGNEAPSATRLNACGSECVALVKFVFFSKLVMMYPDNDGWETTAPVGSYPGGQSPFGALDMVGNVREWMADWYGDYPKLAKTDPQGPSTGTSRVSRGGGWSLVDVAKARAADRDWPDPMLRAIDLGFRCARGR
jgi:formylglycine-generating enzyme required for sulfatase activity/serine/threonine protein kinase